MFVILFSLIYAKFMWKVLTWISLFLFIYKIIWWAGSASIDIPVLCMLISGEASMLEVSRIQFHKTTFHSVCLLKMISLLFSCFFYSLVKMPVPCIFLSGIRSLSQECNAMVGLGRFGGSCQPCEWHCGESDASIWRSRGGCDS